jgi:putative FmdB family regulatory protein
MPIYEFRCTQCKTVHEEWLSFEERETYPDTHQCTCGGSLLTMISLPYASKMNATKGLHASGYKSLSFGKTFTNKMQEYKHAEENGYSVATDQKMDDVMEKGALKRDLDNNRSDTWTTELKKAGGDKTLAATKTFTVDNMKKWGDMK